MLEVYSRSGNVASLCSVPCRRAFLEQAKRDGAGLQNGHLQNGQPHLNGNTNGTAEHTMDMEVRACLKSVHSLQ